MLLAVLTSKSDHGPSGKPGWVCTNIPASSKVSTDLGCCKVFIQLYSAIAVLAMCPRSQGYIKRQFYRTNCRSGRASSPGLPAWHAAALTAQPSTRTECSALLNSFYLHFPKWLTQQSFFTQELFRKRLPRVSIVHKVLWMS
jgi:hypothetical protein